MSVGVRPPQAAAMTHIPRAAPVHVVTMEAYRPSSWPRHRASVTRFARRWARGELVEIPAALRAYAVESPDLSRYDSLLEVARQSA